MVTDSDPANVDQLKEMRELMEQNLMMTPHKKAQQPPKDQPTKQSPQLPLFVCLFVCGISLTSDQLVSELFPDCTRSCFSQVVLRRRGGDRIYEMRCLFVAVGPNARFIVLPHWDNMS